MLSPIIIDEEPSHMDSVSSQSPCMMDGILKRIAELPALWDVKQTTTTKTMDGDNDATNDYSSYWQSIPDPPTASPLADDYLDLPIVSRISKDEDDDNVVVRKVSSEKKPNVSTEMPTMMKKKRQRCVPPLPLLYNKSDDYDKKEDDEEAVVVELVRHYIRLPTTTTSVVAEETTTTNNENNGTTTLSTNNNNNKTVRDIESLTGYPMPGTRILPDLTNAINRSAYLRRIQPLVQAMEVRKKIDIDEALCATRCEVRKEEDEEDEVAASVSKKKGSRYSYFDVDRKEKVSVEDYQRRYTTMINKSRQKRWMRVAQQQQQQHYHYGMHATDNTLECRDDDDDDDGSNMDMDESTNMDDSSTMMLIPIVADNEAVDYDANQKEEDRLINNNTTSTIQKLDVLPSSSSIHTTSTSSSNAGIVNLSLSTSNTNSETLLSSSLHYHNNILLPSNVADTTAVEGNIDPHILVAARQRLWNAIDVALANYSREILAIQEEGKKQEK